MAETLEEFLVSVKYGIDEPSQAKFFDALKRAATSIAGIAGQIVGLGVAVLKLADHMSEAGTKLYWMSQRTAESVTNIQAMSFALTELGLSGEHATTALNAITNWTSSRGPAATMYLRALGVTAATAAGQIQQLGQRLLASGERGSVGYAIELNRMRSMGLDEETLRRAGSKEYSEKLHEEGIIRRLVWGKDGDKGPEKFAAQSVKIQAEFGKMNYVFTSLSQRFASGLFTKIQPELEKLNEQLIHSLPQIKAFLDQIIAGAPALLHFLEGAIKGFGYLLETGTTLIKMWRELPELAKFAVEAFLLMPKALELLRSPIFWVLGGLTALLIMMDDYKHWQDDQKHPFEKPTSAFDWGKADKMFQGLGDNKFLSAMKDFYGYMKDSFEKATGIKGVFDEISVIIGVIVARYGIPMLLKLMGRGTVAGVSAGVGALAEATGVTLVGFGASVVLPVFLAGAAAAVGTILFSWLDEKLQTLFKYLHIDRKMDLSDPIETPWPMPGGTGGQGPAPQWWLDFKEWMKKYGPTGYQEPGMTDPELAPPDPAKRLHPQFPSILRKRTSMMQGGTQVASAGDDWAAYIRQGMDSAHEDDGRLYDMIKVNIEIIAQKSTDILDTLMSMARHSGAISAGVGEGDGGDGKMDVPDLADMTEQEKRTLGVIRKYESEGKNVMNFVGRGQGLDPKTPYGATAQGYYQMLNSNWAKIAPLYNIHAQNAMAATDAERTQVALHLLRHGGIGNWANYNPKLKAALARGEHLMPSAPRLGHVPLGGGAAGGGAPDARGGRGASMEIHNNTSIAMTAPNPGSAAMQVAEKMTRVYEHHIRFAKGSLLA